ncbi:unnamed protein product [Arabidopsis thaliana]|uniref:(thale cress) hypothetical protein n=1 Tax=Arabidopsis thaliana TaxID=3702 RepID=A0A7G2EUN8_ARATH|nr:unnamed protein product [Arabidopsis thaliana]
MGSAMSLSCSKRKATSQDVDSESCKRRKTCSTNDAENCIFIPDESSWSLCANRVISVAAVALPKFRFQQDNQEIEEVTSTELVFEFTLDNERYWKIGECGIVQRETRLLRRSSSPDLSPESSRVSSYNHC